MDYKQIDRSPEPIRVFGSDFIEFFTHVHPAVVLILWGPVVVYLLFQAIVARPAGVSLVHVPLAFLLGLFVWTFVEYMMHRFVFHHRARTDWMERALFMFHSVHHLQPHIKTRLVMPPAASIPLALLFYGLFVIGGRLLTATHWVAPLFSGFMLGYIIYDMLHYTTHHVPMRWRWFKYLRRYHMLHHFKTPDQRFGVTGPLWDIVFGTRPTG